MSLDIATVFASPGLFSLGIYVVLGFVFLFYVKHIVGSLKRMVAIPNNLPPGPKGLPLLGNLLDIPQTNPWDTFMGWSRTFDSDVIHLSVLGRHILLLNSAEATADLFESRFEVYSDRPNFPLATLIGHGWNFGFMPYGKQWRSLRKMFTSKYSVPTSLQTFHEPHRVSVARLLQNTYRKPDEYFEHIRLRAGQLILDITYGIHINSFNDPLIKTADAVMNVISVALSPPMWLVNPAMLVQLIPSWLGGSIGMGLKRWRADLEDLRNKPFDIVKQALAKGCAKPSYTASFLEELTPSAGSEEEAAIRDTSAIAVGAGFETTVITGEVFLLAMVLNPEVQVRAQEEIDRVVGTHRLPDFVDRDHLPYVTAIAREVFRWMPPAPGGIPHMLREDDTYKGYHMPGGSIVMGNVWGILHDPKRYPEPHKFIPERFIRDGVFDCSTNDPNRWTFGFGRRICPGKLLSEDSLWLTVAQFLAVFKISLPQGSAPPPTEYGSGGTLRMPPFKVNIIPRSATAVDLVGCALRE